MSNRTSATGEPNASRGASTMKGRSPSSNARARSLWSDSLWGKPTNTNARCRTIVVIGPYPTRAFFKTLAEKFRPREATVVIDEGWRDEEIKAVKNVLSSNGVKTSIRYAGCDRGIVHAKLYYLEWEVTPKGSVRRKILWGSANASQGGFGFNAEALSSFAIPAGTDSAVAVEAYFKRLARTDAGQRIQETLVQMAPGLQLLLPGFEIRADVKDISFDAWLQKGVLCHPYQPDPSFGSFAIHLKKPLPPGALAKYVASQGMASEARHDVLRMPFVKFPKAEKLVRPRWRTQFFVESWLGYWTSAECVEAEREGSLRDKQGEPVRFVAPGGKKREQALRELTELTPRNQLAWLNLLRKRLKRVYKGLKKRTTKPGRYFRTVDGELDIEHYLATAKRQLRTQSERAQIPGFRERFLKGFEITQVPPLRGIGTTDGEQFKDPFDEFAKSIAETIAVLSSRRRKENRLMLRISYAMNSERPPEYVIPTNDAALLRWLRTQWPLKRRLIREFHKPLPVGPLV